MKFHYIRILIGLILVLGFIAAGQAFGADLYVGPAQTYTTIQSAVDAAAVSGDVIHVEAGTYVEQVLVDGKDLAIIGAGQGATIIESPDVLAVFYATSYDHHPVVGVQNGVVDISALTIDGAGKGNANYKMMGADFHNAGGSVDDVEFVRVRDEPFSGAQHGVSIYLYNEDAVARSFTMNGCLVHDYQKNATAFTAAGGTPLTLTITDNETVGAGPTMVTAQNGIQVMGADVTATITGNIVRDVAWAGDSWTATGVLLYDCSGTVSGNTISACQTGLNLSCAPMSVADNEFLVTRATDFGYGLLIDNYDWNYAKASDTPLQSADPVDPDLRIPAHTKATFAMSVTGNTFTLDPALDDNAGTLGVEAYSYSGYDDLDITVTGNTFIGLETATAAAEYAPTTGAILAAEYGQNEFRACTQGLYSNLPALTVMAEMCWWGAVDGPSGDGPGSGSEVVGLVDYDPWVADYENLLCDPDPLDLTAAAPAGTVVFDYTGGASGRIYGYSIDVQWDINVATADRLDFTRPATGGFASAQPFIVQDIGPGHVRVDAAIGGATPGIYDGPLFQALFTAAGDEGATTPITVTVNNLRDNLNQPLAGLVSDPGLIRVDTTAPAVGDVLVTDTTLGSTEWTGDGHTVTVDATVVDGDIATLTCDLTAFGGPVLELGDAAVVGDVYTWTWGPLTGTGDGPVTATVVCTDGLGQTAQDADEITADNTAPASLSALAATPGHETIHLAWTEPAADAGSPLQGVVFRYAAWGGSPHYAGALPDAPADVTAGDLVGTGPVTGAAWDWPIVPRDVHVIAGFVVDFVGNASALDASAAATNYWLGDVDADGNVTVDPDITALGDTYGLAFGETGYDEDCDVGPTMDYSPRGIPNPQTDGYVVDFEDMMVFGLNYGEVGPLMKFAPGAVPEMLWERLDETTWTLSLASSCAGLKGVNVVSDLPDGVTCQVSSGALLARQDAPVFLRNIPQRGLDAGLAVMGQGEAIEGAGELMRVSFSAPVDAVDVKIAARDLNNAELLVDLPQTTDVETPSVHRLEQNHPNPFNPATTIAFALPRSERVQLAIYSVDGRLVRTLLDEERGAGRHEVVWQGRDNAGRQVATGTYFYSLRAGDYSQVRKLALVK